MNITIVDSCTHPKFNADENKFELTSEDCSYKIIKEFAITLPGDCDHSNSEKYIKTATALGYYAPIVAIDPRDEGIDLLIEKYKRLNVLGIKIHPRFLGWDWTDVKEFEKLDKIFSICEDLKIAIFFCTYYSSSVKISPKLDPLHIFAKLLKRHNEIKIVFMHAGGNKLLDYVEFARFNENILLDLSYSPIKFMGSSYDYDLMWTIKNFNNRICFGSDFPYVDRNLAIKNFIEKMKIIYKTEKEIETHKVWAHNILNFLNI